MSDEDKDPRGSRRDSGAAAGKGRAADGESDSLEDIAARAMLEDDAAPPRRARRDGESGGRRRVMTGAAAVDQILNPAGGKAAGGGQAPPAAAKPAPPSDPPPDAPAAEPDAPRKPESDDMAISARAAEARPLPADAQAPMPRDPRREGLPGEGTRTRKAAPPSDKELLIPDAPEPGADARDLLAGGGSFSGMDHLGRAEEGEAMGLSLSVSDPESDDPEDAADDPPVAGSGGDDSLAGYADEDDDDDDGGGGGGGRDETADGDAERFDLSPRPEAAPEAAPQTAPEARAEDAIAATDGHAEEDEAPAARSEDMPSAARTASKDATREGAPEGKDAGRNGNGDLLDPSEAEGASTPDASVRRDPDAGSGERDLLSGENLKSYLEAVSAAQSRGAQPPAAPAERTTNDESLADAEAARDGDGGDASEERDDAAEDPQGLPAEERRETGERRAEPREDDRRGDAKKNWAIKPSPGTKDDPLLGCLTILCTLLDRNISAEGLTSGLPMVDGMLTPELFVRAAQRAGISSRLVRRGLDNVNRLSLPCVLLLDQQRACVLTELKRAEGKATVILPEMGAGARDVDYAELSQEYVGYALFARPEFQYDKRAEETKIKDPKGWFWGTIFGSWKLYVEVMIAAIMINTFVIANPLFVMNVYDRVVPNFAEETLWVLAIGILIVYLFDFLLKLLRAYLVDVAGKSADTQIAGRLFQQMMGMKMANRPPSAGGLANSMREFEHLREFFTSSTLTSLIDFPFIFLFLTIISVIGTWKIVVIPALIVFLVIIVGMIMQIPMQRVVRETQREAQQKHAILIEAISGIETIKATASEGRMQRAWETFVDKTARSAMVAARWSQLAMNFSGTMMQMVTVAVVVVGVYEIQEGNMSVGALVACTILSGRALAPLSQIAGIATRFHQSRQALHALDGMMKTPVERPEDRTFVSRPTFTGNIEFKNVSFTYPEGKTEALTDVSFKVEAGEKIGVIGRIGSGKSTLERLILGLYESDEGAVLVDGTDTRQIDPADLRRAIGVVPQDVYLFWGTVRENIALGAPYADDQTILRAARIAGVDEFIAKHPLGLDMPVGERGTSLSGGQRQAISIARALLLDPTILVLDEPTSAMDNTTEARFKARLGTVLANKTLFLVTHRGSLLSLVDRLIVMDGGRIVADGPKDMVMEALNAGRIQTART